MQNPNWEMMAADRLTQLQDAVNQQAENFCNSIGVLQNAAGSSIFSEYERSSTGGNTPTAPVAGPSNDNPPGASPIKLLTPNPTPTPTPEVTPNATPNATPNPNDNVDSSPHIPNVPGLIPSYFEEIFKLKSEGRNEEESSNPADERASASNQVPREDAAPALARLIATQAKAIDTLIDSLPPTMENEHGSEFYSQALSILEYENAQSAEELRESIRTGEILLERIRAALNDIAEVQLKTQSLDI